LSKSHESHPNYLEIHEELVLFLPYFGVWQGDSLDILGKFATNHNEAMEYNYCSCIYGKFGFTF